MNLTEITKLVWEHKAELNFGSRAAWEDNAFLKDWVEQNTQGLWCNKEGLYWISCDITCEQLTSLARPENLPSSGCDFGVQSTKNVSILSGNLCADNGIYVIYNGHRSKVMSRLRAHFFTSDGTGALGIKNYNLSRHKWSAYLFHINMIDDIPGIKESQKLYIKTLLESESGRCAVESAWRTLYGWPVLCKK
ncbi:MAG: hypothetical protein HRT51_09405 [Colwellia sp.]|nr:hypothetical protein [Colwellia sp.]